MVEDDGLLRNDLARFLHAHEFAVTSVGDAREARNALAEEHFDLALLDIMLPGESGLSLAVHIRERYDLGIMFLTGRAEELDRVLGWEMGADDYVEKPCNPRELLARIRSLARRVQGKQRAHHVNVLSFAGWTLNVQARELVSSDGVVAPLSTGEFNLLYALAERPRRLLTRQELSARTGAADGDRAIDNQVSRLRRKLEPDPSAPRLIKTVRGGGYMLNADVRRA